MFIYKYTTKEVKGERLKAKGKRIKMKTIWNQTFRRNVDVVEYMILPTRHPEGTIGCLFGASVQEETFQYGFMPLERPAGAIGSLFGTSAQDELFNTDLCRSNVP